MTKAGFCRYVFFISAHQTRQATAGIHHQRSKRPALSSGIWNVTPDTLRAAITFPCVLNTGTAMQRTPRESLLRYHNPSRDGESLLTPAMIYHIRDRRIPVKRSII